MPNEHQSEKKKKEPLISAKLYSTHKRDRERREVQECTSVPETVGSKCRVYIATVEKRGPQIELITGKRAHCTSVCVLAQV